MSSESTPDPFRRLHPLSPLVRGARGIGVVSALVSYQAWGRAGWRALAIAAALILLLWFISAWVQWRFTGFQVTPRELHIRDGVLARRQRTIPLERVQAVDVVRPALARPFGLAEVRMEVVGGGKQAEAPLAYLTKGEAEQLRVHLLRLAADAGAPAKRPAEPAVADGSGVTDAVPADDAAPIDTSAPTAATAARSGPAPLFVVDSRRLVLSQMLTVNTLSAPLLAITPILQFASETHSIATVFAFFSAIVGVIQVPVRRVLGEWGFTVGRDAGGLRVHRGLLDVRNQTIPVSRVQAVRIRRPLLWRPFGWVRIELDVAGYAQGGRREEERSALVPVATAAEAFAMLHQLLPAVPEAGPDALGLEPAPARARWRVPLQHRRLGSIVTDTLLVTRGGWLTVWHDVALHARAQSVRVSQGPWQRVLGLASVHLDPAGGHTTPTILHQDVGRAAVLAAALTDRARAERGAHRATEQLDAAAPPPDQPVDAPGFPAGASGWEVPASSA